MTVVGLIGAAISEGPLPLAGRGRPDGGALLAMAGKLSADLQIRLAPQAMMAFDAQHRRRLCLHCRGGAAGAHGPCHSEEGHHFPAAGEWRRKLESDHRLPLRADWRREAGRRPETPGQNPPRGRGRRAWFFRSGRRPRDGSSSRGWRCGRHRNVPPARACWAGSRRDDLGRRSRPATPRGHLRQRILRPDTAMPASDFVVRPYLSVHYPTPDGPPRFSYPPRSPKTAACGRRCPGAGPDRRRPPTRRPPAPRPEWPDARARHQDCGRPHPFCSTSNGNAR